MPRREEGIKPMTIAIALIIVFLLGKFLGLWKVFNIDPFGVEPEWVYGVLAIAVGILYKEIRDLDREMKGQFQRVNDNLTRLGEKMARLEGLTESRKS